MEKGHPVAKSQVPPGSTSSASSLPPLSERAPALLHCKGLRDVSDQFAHSEREMHLSTATVSPSANSHLLPSRDQQDVSDALQSMNLCFPGQAGIVMPVRAFLL